MKYLAILFLLAACGSNSKLSSDGRKVEIMIKPSTNCEVVGKVVGINEDGSVELARNHARNLVADEDGNAIIIDEEVANGHVFKVYATGYRCN